MRTVTVNGDALTIEDVVDVARGAATAELAASVAAAMEALAHLSTTNPVQVRSLRESRDAAALAEARTCYDHLAGRAGVALLEALLARGVLASAPGGGQPAACGPNGGAHTDGNGVPSANGPGGTVPRTAPARGTRAAMSARRRRRRSAPKRSRSRRTAWPRSHRLD